MSTEKQMLIDEIKMIMEKALNLESMKLRELEALRDALEPSVYEWNDAEEEYQHLVDIFGGGNDPYNYDNYIMNKHERRLLNTLSLLQIDSYHCFLPKEAMEQISKDFIEHRTGYTLVFDYDNGVIIANK